MVEEPAIDPERPLALVAVRDGAERLPGVAVARLARQALAEHQHVDHHLGAGIRQHRRLRQPHGRHQVGHAGDMHPRGVGALVQAPARHHEGGDAARLEALDGAGQEVVVQRQPQLAGRVAGSDRPVGEWRVADRQIEALGDRGLGEVLRPHPGVRIQPGGDARGDRVHLDRGDTAPGCGLLRHRRQEQAGAAAGLQHMAAGEAHAFQRLPHRPDSRLGRVVRILRRPHQPGPLGLGGDRPQRLAQRLPAGTEALSGRGEQAGRQLGGAEAGEARKPHLFLGGGGAVLGLQRLQQPDCVDGVGGAGLPAMGEATIAAETEVGRRHPRGLRHRGKPSVVIGVGVGVGEYRDAAEAAA